MKKTRKLVIALLLCAAMLLGLSAAAYAEDTVKDSGRCGANTTWKLYTSGRLVISGSGAMPDFSNIDAPWYGYRTFLTSVEITQGVTNIGAAAFRSCSRMTGVTIPTGVTAIGGSAFEGCSSLKTVTIPSGVTAIGESAFEDCSALASVTIPATVGSIGKYAFYKSGLTSLTIPASVENIGYYAFGSCSALASLTIKSGVKSIGEGSFNSCTALKSVKIPSSVTGIGPYAFSLCKGLTSLTISSGVTSIGTGAFSGCSGLTSVTVPKSVTTIGANAFGSCSALTKITAASDSTSFTTVDGVLFNKDKTRLVQYPAGKTATKYTVPAGVTTIGGYAFNGCTKLTNIKLADDVTKIETSAFCNCTALASVNIPTGVTSIGEGAFTNCKKLVSVKLPSGVTKINDQCFYNCSALTSVTIPDGVTGIGNYAFSGCSALAQVKLPAGVTKIGDNAFSGSSITEITIPAAVKTIGYQAFGNCTALNKIFFTGSAPTSIDEKAFAGVKADVMYPTGDTSWNTNIVGKGFGGTLNWKLMAKPDITTQPKDKAVAVGKSVSFSVVAYGDELSYQWYYLKPGASDWAQVSATSGKTAKFSISKTEARHNGYQYKCVVKNTLGETTSSIVALTVVKDKPVIKTQPTDCTVNEEKTASFSVEATGEVLKYQWYFMKAGESEWTAVSAASGKTAEYKLTAKARHDGYKYRCKVSNPAGEVYTKSVLLTVKLKPVITAQPTALTVNEGKTATFTVTANGATAYQWYYQKPDTTTWVKVTKNGVSPTYSLTTAARHDGYTYRCKVSNGAGYVYSESAKLTLVLIPTIKTQPSDKTVNAGETATFKVVAEGEGLSYQWWYLKPSETEWTKVLNNGTSATLKVSAKAKHNGYQYRCVVTNAAGEVTSATATLTVN